MTFERPGIGERLSQLGYLVKHTFTIVGRDRDIVVPVAKMSLYAALVVAVFFAGLAAIAYGRGGTGAWLLLLSIVLFVYKFFFYNRTELALSRMVYETSIGNDPSSSSVRKQLSGLGSQVWALSLLDMAGAWIASRRGKGGFLSRIVLGGLLEVWDLVNHFLLPAIAIDRKGIKDGASDLGRLKENVPETLAGVFGIDMMGGVVASVMAPLYTIAGVLGLLLGLFLGGSMPEAFSGGQIGALFPTIPAWLPFGPETVFNWLPLFVVVFLSMVANAVFARLVTAVKVVYFTLFYTRITHAEDLAPDIREDLEGYLRMEPDAGQGMATAAEMA